MSQARRQRKFNTATQKLIGHGLREIVLIFFCFMGLYLFVSLFTYYPLDPGWTHTGQVEEVRNKGGVAGALFADIFFFLFGYFAYLFPIMVGYMGWMIYKGRHHDIFAEPKNLVVPGIGFVLTLSAGCGLAIVHFATETVLLPSHAGGILGTVVGKGLQGVFSQLGATLLLLALFFTGVTLLTGMSWLKLMDTLGLHTLRLMPVVEKHFAQQFLPWLLKHLDLFWRWFIAFLGAAFVKSRDWTLDKWDAFQARREEWRYDDRYDDEDDDEEFEFEDEPRPRNRRAEREAKAESESIADTIAPFELEDHDLPASQVSAKKPNRRSKAATQQDEVPFLDGLEDEGSQKPARRRPVVQPEPVDEIEEAVTVEETAVLVPAQPVLAEVSLLENTSAPSKPDVKALSKWITQAFAEVSHPVKIKAVHPGPALIGFEVQPEEAIDAANLEDLSQSLATVLNVPRVKMVETAPNNLGIEVPNPKRQAVPLAQLVNEEMWQHHQAPLSIALGKDVIGQPVIVELTRIPHLILAGSDPAERDMVLNSILLSLLFKHTPESLRLVLVDGRNASLSHYESIPHLLTPLVTNMDQVAPVLQWCVQEMERRYRLMAKKGARNIDSYNQMLQAEPDPTEIIDPEQPDNALPYILIVVQEIAELTLTELNSTIEEQITRLTQKARAAGLHLILATQYPSVNVVTGLLKANIPSRIALQVNAKSESRTVLGQLGAENLMGEGDLLYLTPGTGLPARIHGAQVSLDEVDKVLHALRECGEPEYIGLEGLNNSY